MVNVLCVDDVDTNLFTLEALLKSFSKQEYNTILVNSGQKALDVLLSRSDIDIILLDVMMPELDGFDTAKYIQSSKLTRNIPIIFLTAKTDGETIANAFKVGGSDYIAKPYNADELYARISFHINLKITKDKLVEEKKISQKILDLQENIIIITDGEEVDRVNKRFLDFFNIRSFDKAKKDSLCVCDYFIEDDDYFHLGKIEDGADWLEYLLKVRNEEHYVLMKNRVTQHNHIFKFSISIFSENKKYIISLTDITHTVLKSKEFEDKATHDALTGVYNRSAFNDFFEKEVEYAKYHDISLSLVIMDIDHFKDVNDTYGHLVGDLVLQKMSLNIDNHTRKSDFFARWGGEEFVLLLVGSSHADAIKFAEKIRLVISNIKFDKIKQISCSFGVSTYKKTDTIDSMIKRADDALYLAKESGRNIVKTLEG